MACCPLPVSDLHRRCPPGAPRRHGFTLVELMVTMAVMVIVLAMATPSMADFTANNQLSSAKSALASALALARSEAARRGLPVIVAAKAGGAGGNELGKGWELVADDDSDGAAADSEPRLRVFAAPDARVRIAGPTALIFRATGALSGNAAQVYTVCRSDGSSRGYSVTVTPSGVADVATISSCT